MQSPKLGHAFELMIATILERETRPGGELTGGGRHQDLTRLCHSHHPGSDVNGQPTHVAGDQLDFSRVDTDPDHEVLTRRRTYQGLTTPDGTARAVEARQEPIAGGDDLMTAVTVELEAGRLVVRAQHVFPVSITQAFGESGRIHHVGEEERREYAVAGRWRLSPTLPPTVLYRTRVS